MNKHKTWTLVLGRFQCLPPHKGHTSIIDKLLEEGKNVAIGLREADMTSKNPYGSGERYLAFAKIYKKQMEEGIIKIVELPDIDEVAYGRTPGWKIREVVLPKEVQEISATKIRNG
jgi:nicotinamide mononucleotide adenylyltransferase